MLSEAENKEKSYKRGSYTDRDSSADKWKDGKKKIKTSYGDEGKYREDTHTKSAYYQSKHNRDSSKTEFKKYPSDRKDSTKKKFLKPSDEVLDCGTEKYISSRTSSSSVSNKGWKKKEFRNETDKQSNESKNIKNEVNKRGVNEGKNTPEKEINEHVQEKPLSDKEMNELGAKITKAEILGNIVSS